MTKRWMLNILPVVLIGLAMPLVTALGQGRQELAASVGAGSLIVKEGGGTTPVFSLSYQFHFTEHVSAEGALDVFTYKFRVGPLEEINYYRDGYLGAEAAGGLSPAQQPRNEAMDTISGGRRGQDNHGLHRDPGQRLLPHRRRGFLFFQ